MPTNPEHDDPIDPVDPAVPADDPALAGDAPLAEDAAPAAPRDPEAMDAAVHEDDAAGFDDVVAPEDDLGDVAADVEPAADVTAGQPLASDPLSGGAAPSGEELVAEVTADDLDAPDAHPGAADPAAADSPRSRRDLFLVGGAVAILLVAVGAFLLLRGAPEPAYTAYGDPVTVEDLQLGLDGLADAEAIALLPDLAEVDPAQRDQLAQAVTTLITQDVMATAAEERGIEVTEEDVDAQLAEVLDTAFGGDQEAFDTQLEQAGLTQDGVRTQFRTALLAEALVGELVDPIDDEAVQQAYDEQFAEPTVAHVLVETAEEAQAVLDRLDAGEEFGAVAEDVSTDPGSGPQGGRLGPLVPGQFVPEFEEAAAALEVGEVSEPVETQFGFHVITLQDPPPLEEVREQLTQALEDQQLNTGFVELAQVLDEEAQITVAEALGTWGGLAQGLIPPEADLPLPDAPIDPSDLPAAPAEGEGVPGEDAPADEAPADEAPLEDQPAEAAPTEG